MTRRRDQRGMDLATTTGSRTDATVYRACSRLVVGVTRRVDRHRPHPLSTSTPSSSETSSSEVYTA